MDVVESLVVAGGPLAGVAMGSWLSQLQARRGWRRQDKQQVRSERLEAYIRFITAARTWQSNVLHPDVKTSTSPSGVPFADAGDAFVEAIRALAEIRLVSRHDRVIEAAVAWDHALRSLSEARAAVHPSPALDDELTQVKAAEGRFLVAARHELGDTRG